MQQIKVILGIFFIVVFSGNGFASLREQFSHLEGASRENFILKAVAEGQAFPSWEKLTPVTVTATLSDKQKHSITFYVSPDYLQLGDEQEFFWAPLQFASVKKLMASMDVLVPTVKMVNIIYQQAALKIWAKTIPSGPLMSSSPVSLQHTDFLFEQLEKRGMAFPCDCLSAGHKKDYVLTKRLLERPNREAIYGWFERDGSVIQPLSMAHNDQWVDYSQGFRAVASKAMVDGVEKSVVQILRDPLLSQLISDEGPMDLRKLINN